MGLNFWTCILIINSRRWREENTTNQTVQTNEPTTQEEKKHDKTTPQTLSLLDPFCIYTQFQSLLIFSFIVGFDR